MDTPKGGARPGKPREKFCCSDWDTHGTGVPIYISLKWTSEDTGVKGTDYDLSRPLDHVYTRQAVTKPAAAAVRRSTNSLIRCL